MRRPAASGRSLIGQGGEPLLRLLARDPDVDIVKCRQRNRSRTIVDARLRQIAPLFENLAALEMREDVVRIDGEDLADVFQRGVEIALADISLGPAGDGILVFRIPGGHLAAFIDRVVELALFGVDVATKSARLARLRIGCLCRRELGQRAVIIPVQQQHAAAIEMRMIQIALDPQRGVEVVERALQRALAKMQGPAIVVGHREIRALVQGQIVIGKRQIILSLALVGPAAHVEQAGIVRIELDPLAVGLERLVEIALLEECFAAHPVGKGEVLGRRFGVGDQAFAGVIARLLLGRAVTADRDVVARRRVGQRGAGDPTEKDERETKPAPHAKIAPPPRQFVGPKPGRFTGQGLEHQAFIHAVVSGPS